MVMLLQVSRCATNAYLSPTSFSGVPCVSVCLVLFVCVCILLFVDLFVGCCVLGRLVVGVIKTTNIGLQYLDLERSKGGWV